jgi:hypothetical protein
MRKALIVVSGLAMVSLLIGCGGEQPTEQIGVAAYLPNQIENPDVPRTGEIEVFRGDSLYHYINGGAEIYHTYGFEEVAHAYYQADDYEISVDLYEFEEPAGAYGLYSTLRPPDPEVFPVGVEGFASSHTRDFVKGRYMARVSAYEANDKTSTAMDSLAATLAETVPGSEEMPSTFRYFPDTARIPNTEKIHSVAYLSFGFLNDVYTVDYVVDGDTATLFLTVDTTGQKMDGWQGNIPGDPIEVPGLDELGYDGLPLGIEHDYYDTIVGGTKSGWMAGAVSYDPSHRVILSRLLEALRK